MDCIDVELFIDEVRKRPCLWDSSSEHYTNKRLKSNAWLEICAVFSPNFNAKDENEKTQFAKGIQVKWRHIRDAFVRHNRLKSKKKSGRFVRSYVYARHLKFLKIKIKPCETEDTLKSEGSAGNVAADEDIQDISDNNAADRNKSERRVREPVKREYKDIAPNSNFRFRNKNIPSSDPSISYINSQQNKVVETEPENDDMAFFRSLLPTLQTLRAEQKLTFRVDVMKLLIEYHKTRTTHQSA